MMKPTRNVAYAIVLLLLVAAIGRWMLQSPPAKTHAISPARAPEPEATFASSDLEIPPPQPRPEPPATEDSKFVPIDRMAGSTSAVDGPGLLGYWYSYSDATPDAFVKQRPRNSYPSIVYRGKAAREFTGGGQSDWGAGFGFDLTEWSAAKLRMKSITASLDASQYQGIQFEGMSRNAATVVEVAFSDVNSSPKGGLCTSDDACNADYSTTVTFPDDHWQTFTVYFSRLTRPSWAMPPPGGTPPFAKDKLYSIHFQLHPTSRGSALGDFDLLVANVSFIRS